ncbi:hypothetical protein INR49_027183 [Caranx melampygus]|nr:hypothetical protein INR49_027183 [Caranx melampygus]
MIDAGKTEEEEGEEGEVEEGGRGLVRAKECRHWDSINNNSLGKKDSWKDSHSSSPHITGDLTPTDIQPKVEDKVRHNSHRPAPRPPTANGAHSKANAQAPAPATDTRVRLRERQASGVTQSSSTPRTQRRGGGGGGGRGGGRVATAMKERNLGDIRGKDGVTAGKEERRGGRLCAESKAKEKERNGHQRPKETNGPKGRGLMGKQNLFDGYGGSTNTSGTGCKKPGQDPRPSSDMKESLRSKFWQSHDRTQDNPPALSRSSSEGGSNRMSLSSDTEGPPPGPLHPSVSLRTNPDISEEEGEGDPTPCVNVQNGPIHCLPADEKTVMDCAKSEMDCTKLKVDARRGTGDSNTEVKSSSSITQGDSVAAWTEPQSEAAAGLNYDSVKYTLVVDEHAQLELVSLKNCFHGYSEHNDDSDGETVYQSANEEEDPEYEEERKKREDARKQGRKEEENRRKEEEEKKKKKRWEEDVKRRREEDMKRRREVVARICKQSKVTSATTSEEEESQGGRPGAPRSRKFLNLFANSGSSNYSATGAGSFGVFSCVLDGVERQQSHRAVYRFVPRHADELYLETDDPVLMLNQSEDLWCQGYNMRTGAAGIFPAFYTVKVAKDVNPVQKDGWTEQFLVRFLGSVQVPIHKGNDVLCAAMQKVACNRRLAGPPPSACVLEVSVKGVKINVEDQCHSAHRGEQCFHFFQLKNISFCGCHPKHSKYFAFITKHPDQQRFACHVMMSDTTLHPLAESVGRAFQQYYKEHIGYSCPTEDIFIE